MKTFKLRRLEDVSGVSGTGIVAEGVEFHDGQVVMSWLGVHHTMVVAPNIQEIERIHGHGGKSVVEWDKVIYFTPPNTFRRRKARKYLERAARLLREEV